MAPTRPLAPVAFIEGDAAAALFRHKLFTFLQAEGLLSQARPQLLLSWRHSRFFVHNAVTVAPVDREGLKRLCRYMLRQPVNLERLARDEDAGTVTHTPRPGHYNTPHFDDDVHDLKELLARAVMHIPEPRRHLVPYDGTSSNAVRARRKRAIARGDATSPGPNHEALSPPSTPTCAPGVGGGQPYCAESAR